MTNSKDIQNLTDDEAALYDRQIRLWGLDAQKRLRGSRVLLIGIGGLAAEVGKNIVLAGIKQLTILDENNVMGIDKYSQFLIPYGATGNRATLSVERLQNLNPMVAISALTDSNVTKDDMFFAEFDVVCATDTSRSELIRINKICREREICFFAGDVWSLFGFFFTDLQDHEFVEEELVSKIESDIDDDDQPLRKKTKIDQEKQLAKKTDYFVPLEDALNVDWSSESYAPLLKRTNSAYFTLQVLLEFRDKHKRNPKMDDLETLKELKNEVCQKINAPTNKVNDELLRVAHPLNPACAIVGGVLAQEIIKCISKQDAPFNNFFFFVPDECSGIVEKIGH